MDRRTKTLNKFFCFFLLLFMIGMGTSKESEARADLTPAQVVVELLNTVKMIKKSDPDQNILLTSEEIRRNSELSHHVNQMMDIEAISADALWKEWGKQGHQARKTFVEVFSRLLAKVAYTHAGKFIRDLNVSVRKNKVRKTKAMVYLSVVHEEEGRIDIDFKLVHLENSWLVRDVYLDGVSLARNLRTQILKIIREHSFEELLTRMRKKIVEKDTEDLKDITGRN